MNIPRLREGDSQQQSAEQAGRRFIIACGLGPATSAAQMRQLDAKALLQASPSEPVSSAELRLKPLSLVIGPIVDGHVIPDEPNALFASSKEHAVPLIVGNTKEEMALFLMTGRMPADEAAYLKKLKDDFGDQAELLARAYPARDPKQIRSTIIQLSSDMSFVSQTRLTCRAHAAAGQKTCRFQFSRGTRRGFLQSLGAHHGAELSFLFQRPAVRDDEKEMQISRAMGRYWINFAATGNPNGEGLPAWPAYKAGAEEMVDFAQDVKVLKDNRTEQLDVVEKVLQALADTANKK
jgi:para-nitrobenzyl esterase